MKKRLIFIFVGLFFIFGLTNNASALKITNLHKTTKYEAAFQHFLGMSELKLENTFSKPLDITNILAIGRSNKNALIEFSSNFKNIGNILKKIKNNGSKRGKSLFGTYSMANPIADPLLLLATGLAGIGIFNRKRLSLR